MGWRSGGSVSKTACHRKRRSLADLEAALAEDDDRVGVAAGVGTSIRHLRI